MRTHASKVVQEFSPKNPGGLRGRRGYIQIVAVPFPRTKSSPCSSAKTKPSQCRSRKRNRRSAVLENDISFLRTANFVFADSCDGFVLRAAEPLRRAQWRNDVYQLRCLAKVPPYFPMFIVFLKARTVSRLRVGTGLRFLADLFACERNRLPRNRDDAVCENEIATMWFAKKESRRCRLRKRNPTTTLPKRNCDDAVCENEQATIPFATTPFAKRNRDDSVCDDAVCEKRNCGAVCEEESAATPSSDAAVCEAN